MKYHLTKEEFEALDESLRKEYAEVRDGAQAGKFRLKLADNPIGEFREANTNLTRRIEAISAELATEKASKAQIESRLEAFRDDDGNPLDAAEVKRIVKEISDKSGGKKPDVQAVIDAAMRPFKQTIESLQASLAQQTKAAEEERAKAKRAKLEAKLRSAVEPVAATGLSDYLVRDMIEKYDLNDQDEIVAKEHDAEGLPLTPSKFLDQKRSTTPGLFKASGVPGEGDRRPGRVTNPEGKDVLTDPTPTELGVAMKRKADSKGQYDYVVKRTTAPQ